tara:strand:- start:3313 stop:4569 length:1257 start_codon:yes stop_codon:yes gene_type:complete
MSRLNFNLIKKIRNIFFPFYRNSDLKFVFKRLQKDTNQPKVAMFVGGCVRKYLNNEDIDDIDIATSLTPEEIKEKFKDTKFNVIDSGIKHGTVTLVYNKLKLELTTLRKDIKTDGRHAEVEYTDDWQKDSERRDFTINAIYLTIKGKIFDPQSGVLDLKNKNLKFIGDPQRRIEEDYLRIIRLIRFALEYQNEIEQKTFEVIKLNLNGIKKISKERILNELFKILRTKNFVKLNDYKNLKDIFSLIFPEFRYLERLAKLNLINRNQSFSNELLLAVLLIDDTNNHEYFSHKYNVSNELRESLNLLAKNYKIIKEKKFFFKKDLKKNIYFFGKKHLRLLNMLTFSVSKKMKINEYLNNLSNINGINLPIFSYDGNFLKKNGLKEGTIIGRTLKIIESEWIKNNFNLSNKRVLEIINQQK